MLIPSCGSVSYLSFLENEEEPAGSPSPDQVRLSAQATIPHPALPAVLESAPGTTAYDLGTGSGILAIALAKLGAKVAAFEADPVAVAAAKANAELNRVELEIVELDLLTAPPPKRPAQLVVANLTADLFLALGNKLADYLEPDGKLIAGGIASRREQEVKEVFREAGIMIQEAAFDGEWVCLAGRKQRGE